jgi:mono/diheme cytochrome c family protein/glucose/arabinose dehydrogenase
LLENQIWLRIAINPFMPIIRKSLLLLSIVILSQCSERKVPFPEESSPPNSPQEELETFEIEKGFKIQLVASEPMVQDPIAITFDEDGRLWVVEMRGYMTDIDGSEEQQPLGRISVLEDKDGDGVMDKSTVYLDSLVMPRALGLIKGGALVAENNSLWITQDRDGDLKADSKVLLDSTYSQNGIPEHSDNGLLRNIDNWYYSVKSKLRYRNLGGEWVRDSTEARGQWGVSHDDQGRLFYNYNWSQLHADLVPANYLSRNKNHSPSTGIDHGLTIDRRIFPIRPNLAVNRGYIPGTLDEEGKLVEFTSACSPLVFRSTLFPKEYYGNAFVCENAGNLVKRNVVKQNGIFLEAFDPNPGKEFLASTDERFRPVNSTIGPDGAMYIADMYRGMVQHGSYVTPYLREQTLKRNLVLPVHMGRIWRIVPEDWEPSPSPKLSKESSKQLVQRLSHPDGWHRDMAQRLLVEREDVSIKSDLEELVQNGKSELGRFHGLWTLEGLGLIATDLLFNLLDDQSLLMQNTSMRLLENFALRDKNIQVKLGQLLSSKAMDAPIEVALQMVLSAYTLNTEDASIILEKIISRFGENALVRDAVMSSLGDREFDFLQKLWAPENWKTSNPSKEIFLEMLTVAIVRKRDPKELESLLTLLDYSEINSDWKQDIVLTGMSIQAASSRNKGALALKKEPPLLKRTDLKIEPARLEMLKSMFSWPGYTPQLMEVSANSLDEKGMQQFALGRQKYLVTCAGCHGSDGAGVNRMGPPLIASEWVLGDEIRLSLILLHGMEGPLEVAGKKYDAPEILPIMPAHSTMDDASIAAILTYIRNEWGNQAPAISGRTVSSTRHTSQGRVYPWTAPELIKHTDSLSVLKPN